MTDNYYSFSEIMLPFLLPIGLLILGTTIDSIMKYGQSLPAGVVNLPKRGLKEFVLHGCKFMHNFYFACFAYDLSAIINIVEKYYTNSTTINNQLINKNLYVYICIGVIIHILAYFHSYFILREYEAGRAQVYMTKLHSLYVPISILLLVVIRYYQLY